MIKPILTGSCISAGPSKIYGTTADGTSHELGYASDIPSVINNLTSTSATDALSANQGRLLNNKITSASSPVTFTRLYSGSKTCRSTTSDATIILWSTLTSYQFIRLGIQITSVTNSSNTYLQVVFGSNSSGNYIYGASTGAYHSVMIYAWLARVGSNTENTSNTWGFSNISGQTFYNNNSVTLAGNGTYLTYSAYTRNGNSNYWGSTSDRVVFTIELYGLNIS